MYLQTFALHLKEYYAKRPLTNIFMMVRQYMVRKKVKILVQVYFVKKKIKVFGDW